MFLESLLCGGAEEYPLGGGGGRMFFREELPECKGKGKEDSLWVRDWGVFQKAFQKGKLAFMDKEFNPSKEDC